MIKISINLEKFCVKYIKNFIVKLNGYNNPILIIKEKFKL